MDKEKIIDLVGVVKIGPNKYESRSKPQTMGNARLIAYGGCALGNIVHAAYQSISNPKYHLYSLLGQYLGPTLIDRKILCYVFPYRETRTFYSCRIEARQVQDDGKERTVMMTIADFQVAEPAMFTYSAPPVANYSHYNKLKEYPELVNQFFESGALDPKVASISKNTFGLMSRFFNHRPCPEGIGAQNLLGIAKTKPTTQDHLPLTSKTSADWYKLKETSTATSPAEHLAAMAFIMDAALSFIPLTYSHMFLDDAAACSSLDFALRFFKPGNDIDFGKYHLREMKTINGAVGRTYSEAQMWDEDGVMVADMTQQGIMRVKSEAKSKAKAKI